MATNPPGLELHSQRLLKNFINEHPGFQTLPIEEQLKKLRSYGISNMTKFFRDRTAYLTLENIILPQYENPTVASIGCSTGQEAYSIFLVTGQKVDGYDSNLYNLNVARQGTYLVFLTGNLDNIRKIETRIDLEKDNTKLEHDQDFCRVTFGEKAKQKVKFYHHDIVEGELPQKYDIIFLMNLLYHYSELGIERILENIWKSLNQNGWLICESEAWPVLDENRHNYQIRMRNLGDRGFEKQKTILPQYLNQPDQTEYTKAYRKV